MPTFITTVHAITIRTDNPVIWVLGMIDDSNDLIARFPIWMN